MVGGVNKLSCFGSWMQVDGRRYQVEAHWQCATDLASDGRWEKGTSTVPFLNSANRAIIVYVYVSARVTGRADGRPNGWVLNPGRTLVVVRD
jgi:hypothetical protein